MKPESIIEFEKLYGIELNETEDKAHIICAITIDSLQIKRGFS